MILRIDNKYDKIIEIDVGTFRLTSQRIETQSYNVVYSI